MFRSLSSGKFIDIYNNFASGPLLMDTLSFLSDSLTCPTTPANKVRLVPDLVLRLFNEDFCGC